MTYGDCIFFHITPPCYLQVPLFFIKAGLNSGWLVSIPAEKKKLYLFMSVLMQKLFS